MAKKEVRTLWQQGTDKKKKKKRGEKEESEEVEPVY